MQTILVQDGTKIVSGRLQSLRSSKTVWVDIVGPSQTELEELAQHTNIPANQILAWMEGKKRPVAMDFQKYSIITFLAPTNAADPSAGRADRTDKTVKEIFATQPCVMLISNDKNDFITIHKHPLASVEKIKSYSEPLLCNIFRQRATFILFTLLNELVERYFEALDGIHEIVNEAETAALNVKVERMLSRKILHAKKAMIYFHKALFANREVIMAIEGEHLGFLDENMLREFRILSSSITQLIEINSTYRDILNTTTEIHLTAISNSLNMTMKKVTSWGAIILIPSLVAGVFGMNFKHFDMFEWKYGVELSVGLMALSVLLLYLYFRKKDWI